MKAAWRTARHASPDGKSLLVVEMDGSGWLPCRLMPFDGSSTGHKSGPRRAMHDRRVVSGWTMDVFLVECRRRIPHLASAISRWVARADHLGPTEQEGTALTADGTHLITSMGLQRASIWLSEGESERQLTSEGFAMLPTYGPSGQRVFYLLRGGSRGYASGELWSVHLKTGERQQCSRASSWPTTRFRRRQRVVFTVWGEQAAMASGLPISIDALRRVS